MLRDVFIAMIASLAGCSILNSPDGFALVEANPEAACESDGDCLEGARCPKLGSRIGGVEETESYCWIRCDRDPEICEGTAYPRCFPDGSDFAVCLAEATLSGAFSCPADAAESPGGGPSLTLGDGDPVILSTCALRLDGSAERIGIVFSGGDPEEEGARYEVSLALPNRVFTPGQSLDILSGSAVRIRKPPQDGVGAAGEPMLIALFPGSELASRPPLAASAVTINEDGLGEPDGGLRGEVEIEGFAYAAKL